MDMKKNITHTMPCLVITKKKKKKKNLKLERTFTRLVKY